MTEWHFDKAVPVALILAVLAQTFGLGWWASGISHDVTDIKVDMTEIKAALVANVKLIGDFQTLEWRVKQIEERANKERQGKASSFMERK